MALKLSRTRHVYYFRLWANNPCSLNSSKRAEIEARLAATDRSEWPHLMFFAETWFDEATDTIIVGYKCHRQDRDGRGGGVAIYVLDGILTSEASSPQLNTDRVEQLWRVIRLGNESFLLGCLYRPHDHNDGVLVQLIASLKASRSLAAELDNVTTLIYGDFNFSHTNYEPLDVGGGVATVGNANGERPAYVKFLSCLEENHLTQLVTFPTYRSSKDTPPSSTLDLVITNDPDRVISIIEGDSFGSTPMGQAHCLLIGAIAIQAQVAEPPTARPRRIWSRANYERLAAHISSHAWESLISEQPVEQGYKLLVDNYNEATALAIPSTTAQVAVGPEVPPRAREQQTTSSRQHQSY